MNRDDITGGGGGREGGGCTVFCTVNTRDNLLLLTMSARFYFLTHRKKTKCQFCVFVSFVCDLDHFRSQNSNNGHDTM